MRPNLDSESGPEPDELPHDAKLQAGYIRYIRILPTKGPSEELCFETCIRRSQFDDDSDENRIPDMFFYSAISYSWGDPTPSHLIIVDGHERMVARNLWQFLQQSDTKRTDLLDTESFRRLRELKAELLEFGKLWKEAPSSGVDLRFRQNIKWRQHAMIELYREKWPDNWLWIDALCIDQSDARERTHQVGIMSEIFGRADEVIAWLGPAYDNSEHAMTTIAGYTSDRSPNHHSALGQTELSEAICSLCERQYWQRLWVFQELRHAKVIALMCGEVTIPWTEFTLLWRAIVDIATTDEGRSDRLNQSLATRMITLRSKPIDFSLWNLLKETRNLECADQRDRVYALLSVATRGHENIEADYSANTPLRLAHMILQNKYAMRPPRALDDVLMDCEFLEDVFRMGRGDMLRYRRPDAGGHNDSKVRTRWYSDEHRLQEPNPNWKQRPSFHSVSSWYDRHKRLQREHREESSYVDTESSQADSLWSIWAWFHGQTAVARLLQNSI
jgi:hypothetical protein